MVAINQLKAVAASLALIAIIAPQNGAEAAPALRMNTREAVLPSAGRRMERIVVRSTSPPLPAGVKVDAERRSPAGPKPKKAPAPAKKPAAPKPAKAPKAPAAKGGNDHRHIHEHIHDHDHRHGHRGRDRKNRKSDKYSAKNKANHSKHWAIHHGLARREEAESLTERHLIEIGDTYDMSGQRHGGNDDDLVQVLIGRDGLVTRHSRHSGHSKQWWKHHRGDRKQVENDSVHSHVHEHERRHRSDHYEHWYQHRNGDRKNRHNSNDHVHEHIHEHKRGLQVSHEDSKLGTRSYSRSRPFRYHPRDLAVEKRGLIGDVVKPLLAPLNAIPGFITISDLLFSDGGLVKKLGGLVLHAEPAKTAASKSLADQSGLFNYSLMASQAERTQVWLMATDVNGTEPATPDAPAPSAFSNNTTTVRVALPIIDDKGEPVLYCATFDKAPPSALQLQPCVDDASEASPEAVVAPTSQRFSYTSSTGALAPIYMAEHEVLKSSEVPSSTAAASSSTASASSTAVARRSYFRVLAARNETTTAASSTAAPTSTQSVDPTSAATAAPAATSDTGKVQLKFTPAGVAPKKLAATTPIGDDEDSTPADAAADSAEEVTETVSEALPADATTVSDALPLDAAHTDALPMLPVASALPVAAVADDVTDDATEAFTGALDRAAIIDDVSALTPDASEVDDEVNEAVQAATTLSQGEVPIVEDVEEITADPSASIAEALNLAAKPSSTSTAAKTRDTCTCVPQVLS